MKLNDIGEFGFIERLRQGCISRPENVIKGIGDDCCIFRAGEGKVILLTTDMLVEDIHFMRNTIPPFSLGRKALAVNISDIVAMGGIPREAVVSIAIPKDVEVEYLDALYDGMKAMAAEYDVNILGGDTTSAPKHLVINIALTGEAMEKEILYRSGAKVGDIIFVTGQVGSAAAGLDMLINKRNSDGFSDLLEAHFNSRPHVKEGLLLAESGKVNSLIDISDGLASDLGHICQDSSVGAIIHEKQIPINELFREYIKEYSLKFEHLALHVGEDYVLLGTMPENDFEGVNRLFLKSNLQIFRIGEIVAGGGIKMKSADGKMRVINLVGYDHFRKTN